MLQVTIPFTNEVVIDTEGCAVSQHEEVTINRFDEVRGVIHISFKSFHTEDIAVHIIEINCPESVFISARINPSAWIMNFTLSGHLGIDNGPMGPDLKLAAGTHSSFIPATDTVIDAVMQGKAKLFGVGLSENMVKKLLTEEEYTALQKRTNDGVSPDSRAITPAMHDILNSVILCAENNCLHRIFLAAKMLELLFMDVEQLKKPREPAGPALRVEDLEKIKLAKELIARDIQAPCSLIELAHSVGLNDFKLKKGFKETFGTTVFGYLSDLRMEKARNMLLTSMFSVSEVAHNVGYKNAHHFTAAFKKKFGYLPSELKFK